MSVHECRPLGLVLTRGQRQAEGVASHCHWTRFWAAWLLAVLITGIVGDVSAYVSHGYPGTLTMHIRWWTGQEPPTRFARLGQVAVMAFLTWASVHLGFGILGPSRGRVAGAD